MSDRFLVIGSNSKRDAEGNKLCYICEKKIPKHRTTCGGDCRRELEILTGIGIRYYVKQRDKGICAHCGLDCEALEAEIVRMETKVEGWATWMRKPEDVLRGFLRKHGLKRDHFWEAHHVVAVAEGGGQCGLDNYETVCWRCHGKETGALRRRLNVKALRMKLEAIK